ncbi:MAG: endosialidase [Lachnospiraceae bacterium]|nr:endosialidase [Lachnospiraceae bacterium]MBP3578910.1 endosialidase [Lachnospiraceae bacterium]
MADLIFVCENGGLGFGDYNLAEKAKLSDYPHQGDLYKIKTFKEITKLEKNGSFVYESVPGTKVESFLADEKKVSFLVEGNDHTQITLDLEEEKEYRVLVDGINLGNMSTNIGGKLVISVDLTTGQPQNVVIERI